MEETYLKTLVEQLEEKDISFAVGLSDTEIKEIEPIFRFNFPPDLKAFLQYALPVSKGFLNWREDAEKEIRDRLEWPLEGMCFDIEHNTFWLKAWVCAMYFSASQTM